MRAGRIITDLRGSVREAPRHRPGERTQGAATQTRSLCRLHPDCIVWLLRKLMHLGHLHLFFLNTIFFYPTASVHSFSFR